MVLNYTISTPVHNEERFILGYLKSIEKMKPDQVLIGLDRCTDKTRLIIDGYILARNPPYDITLVKIPGNLGYRHHLAGVRRYLFQLSDNDIILNLDADIRPDKKIREALPLIKKYKLISFGYLDYPYTIQSFTRWLIAESGITHGFSGQYLFNRNAWLECENQEELRKVDIMKSEDTVLFQAISGKYPTTHINTKSFHLRSCETPRDNYDRGVSQWVTQRKSRIGNLAHSVIMIRPNTLRGYIQARKSKKYSA